MVLKILQSKVKINRKFTLWTHVRLFNLFTINTKLLLFWPDDQIGYLAYTSTAKTHNIIAFTPS